jgi:acetyl esterase/lipase
MKFSIAVLLCLSAAAFAEPVVQRDIPYVTSGHARQKLDLYVPSGEGKHPLVIWIHGGAWKEGDKGMNPALPLLEMGCAVAGINYRFSQHALYPAQLEDCKAAIRWLRAHADENHLDADRFGVWGISAGGHLVALLGTTGDEKEFDVGENLSVSSRVQCVLDWCGPTDFEQFDKFPSVIKRDTPDSPITQLLGGTVSQKPALSRRANPIAFIKKDAPPFLIMHGDKDDLVPQNQSELLADALQKAGAPVRLYIVKGGGHVFFSPEANQMAADFFKEHLKF